MNILVTGGLGFIGSHTCVELIDKNHRVIIADNLSNSKIETLDNIEKISGVKPDFHKIDVTIDSQVEDLFKTYKFDGVIHFAGYKAVGESVEKPLYYYYNNLVTTIKLSQMCFKYNVKKFVFSSSATVYGDNESPLKEDMELLPRTNPYGETKAMSEKILKDANKANPYFAVSLLRYFNPIGAHKSGLLGEDPNGIPNNLLPYVSKVAKGDLEKLQVFGNDYDTLDGTGVRDYIHVVDLAEGHVAAIESLDKGVNIYNLGTGKGTSVLQVIESFVKVNRVDVPYEIVGRRPGDIAICYADNKKAEEELGWKVKRNIEDMMRDSWRFEKS